ncbi:MAG: hypothetical protein WA152_00710 [Microgenomates group bacterium]
MPESVPLTQQISDAEKRLLAAENELRRPRGYIVLGPMDDETPWSEGGRRVVREQELIKKLTEELEIQVLQELG